MKFKVGDIVKVLWAEDVTHMVGHEYQIKETDIAIDDNTPMYRLTDWWFSENKLALASEQPHEHRHDIAVEWGVKRMHGLNINTVTKLRCACGDEVAR